MYKERERKRVGKKGVKKQGRRGVLYKKRKKKWKETKREEFGQKREKKRN